MLSGGCVLIPPYDENHEFHSFWMKLVRRVIGENHLLHFLVPAYMASGAKAMQLESPVKKRFDGVDQAERRPRGKPRHFLISSWKPSR